MPLQVTLLKYGTSGDTSKNSNDTRVRVSGDNSKNSNDTRAHIQ